MCKLIQLATYIEGDSDDSILYYKDMEGMTGMIETKKIEKIEYGVDEMSKLIVFKIHLLY